MQVQAGDILPFHDGDAIFEVEVLDLRPGDQVMAQSRTGHFFIAEAVRDYHGPYYQHAVLKNVVTTRLRHHGNAPIRPLGLGS